MPPAPAFMSEREFQALLQARELLGELSFASRTPRITRDLRARARAALLHFPSDRALVGCAHPPEDVASDQRSGVE